MDGKYLGEIVLFAGNYTPEDFMDCDGRMLPIQQFQALYSVIGLTYGGDGTKFFALPDLGGRLPVGIKGTDYKLGQAGGVEPKKQTITLTTDNLPAHTHKVVAKSAASLTVSKLTGDSKVADGNVLAAGTTSGSDDALVYTTPASDPAPAGKLGGINVDVTVTAEPSGGGKPLNLAFEREPFLAVRYIICIDGTYPPRANP